MKKLVLASPRVTHLMSPFASNKCVADEVKKITFVLGSS
jgi:hypothetical protein